MLIIYIVLEWISMYMSCSIMEVDYFYYVFPTVDIKIQLQMQFFISITSYVINYSKVQLYCFDLS